MVDAADYDWLNQWNWHTSGGTRSGLYAVRNIKVEGKSVAICMHRVIMATPDELEVDHKNHQTLDNRRVNLRLATRTQNITNQRISRRNTSGFKGVYWDKEHGRWRATISLNGKLRSLGWFNSPETAGEAYRRAATEVYGEFAYFGEVA